MRFAGVSGCGWDEETDTWMLDSWTLIMIMFFIVIILAFYFI